MGGYVPVLVTVITCLVCALRERGSKKMPLTGAKYIIINHAGCCNGLLQQKQCDFPVAVARPRSIEYVISQLNGTVVE